MHIRYRVELDESERQQLQTMIASGTRAVRRVKRAQILLAAADGQSEAAIATTVWWARRPSTGGNGGSSRRASRPRYQRTRGRVGSGSSPGIRKRC